MKVSREGRKRSYENRSKGKGSLDSPQQGMC